MHPARVPNPYDDAAQRTRRIEANLGDARPWRWVVVGGWLVLGLFGVARWLGYTGAGLVLVPIGLGMIIGGWLSMLG